MGLFDNLFRKAGVPGKINLGGQEFSINPDGMMFSQRGLEKYQKDDFAGAVVEFTKAIQAQSGNQHYYSFRGTAYEDMGNDIEAEKDFIKVLQIEREHFVAEYRLGMIYYRKRDFETAVMWLKLAFEHSDDLLSMDHLGIGSNNIMFVGKHIIAGNLGNFLSQLKRNEEAMRYLDYAIKLDPKYPNPYLIKGTIYWQMGQPKDSIPYIKKAIELGMSNAPAVLKMVEEELAEEQKTTVNDGNELQLEFVFHSSDHLRFENKKLVSGPHGGAPRAIKVEKNIDGGVGYTVTMFNTEGERAVVQMTPKQMKLLSVDSEKIILRGYGSDSMGSSFADYGLTIYHSNGNIEKITLHMHDRGVDIQYQP